MTDHKAKTQPLPEPLPCPICSGPGFIINRAGTMPAVVVCSGDPDCAWYSVHVPYAAWQALTRVKGKSNHCLRCDYCGPAKFCICGRCLEMSEKQRALRGEQTRKKKEWQSRFFNAEMDISVMAEELQLLRAIAGALKRGDDTVVIALEDYKKWLDEKPGDLG